MRTGTTPPIDDPAVVTEQARAALLPSELEPGLLEDEVHEHHHVPTGWRARASRSVRRIRRILVAGRWFWPVAIAYAALGWWLATRIDLVVLDALSRSSSAGFVWHNGPPKLAGIGFAWPPMATLPLLAFTVVPAIARTGNASILLSAIAMAAIIPIVRSELARLGVPSWGAITTCVLLALHPMLVYYGANGMSEATGVLLVTVTLVGLLRWIDTSSLTALAVSSFGAATGMMSRYELGVLPLLLAGGVFIAVAIGRRDVERGRALAVFVLIPSIFAATIWMYFNWVVQGSPVWFLTGGYQLATVAGTATTIGGDGDALKALTTSDAVLAIVRTHATFAPLLLLVLAGTLVLFARRRWMAGFVAAMVFTGLTTPLLIAIAQDNVWLAQLRFNMRTIPASIIGAAWIARELGLLRRVTGRQLVASVLVASCVAAIPLSAHLMRTAPLKFTEPSFLTAITQRQALTGTVDSGGQSIGCASARAMGRWVDEHIEQRDTILADTSSMFAVLTYSGHPERFVDPIDHGSAWFVDMLNNPLPRIRYVLVGDFSTCSGVSSDLVHDRFPDLYATGNGGHAKLVHEERGFRLYEFPRSGLEPPEEDGQT